jgi:adenylate cyclase
MVAVLAASGRLQLSGETRPMTIMFCDVRGFTAISEGSSRTACADAADQSHADADERYHRRAATIDKYMGDCIMAFWNAPLDDPDHADDACDRAGDARRPRTPQ